MKAAVVHALHDIRIEQVATPRPNEEEILIKVGAAGVCSTDVKQLAGLSPPRHMPAILGHEVAGRIVEVGSAVTAWELGQRVAVYPIAACGACFYCHDGRHSLCENEFGFGHGINGAFAEFLKVPRQILALGGVVDIGELSYEAGVLIEPLSCVISAARLCGTQPGDTVAVVGCGPMGQLHVYASKKLGARVLALDMNEERLASARVLGADMTLNPGRCDALEEIRAATGQRGADILIIAVGFVDVVESSLPYVRNGGVVNIFGGTPQGQMMTLDPRWLHYGEIMLTGTFGSSVMDFHEAHAWIQEDPDIIISILSHRCSLDDIVSAVSLVREGKGTKTAVVM